ncbi:glycosyltransferase family 4 protein [Alkalibacterium sp. 20]|uniref:glycosyltransferase family 4 protein n=1 Tax=Alkalibacterium sp. 20 TaxID=1798803 RepID=UPI0009000366|nr:glycosyltransferase family 4 protein [Alkalibacterium sp. 20]OJF90747.1 glycosyl transferase [Alkalibacterium sp. 20]
MKKALILASVASMVEAFNQENITLLQKNGFEVHVMSNFHEDDHEKHTNNFDYKKKLEQINVKVYDLPIQRNPLSRENLTVYYQVKKIFKEEDYALIHCHTPIGGVLGRLAAREIKKTGTQVIYTAHGFHFFKGAPIKNWMIFYTVEKLLSSSTDCLITINPEDYNNAVKKHFRMKDIELLNGVGINLNKFRPTTSLKRKTLREKYGYAENDTILIYVGELIKRKNQAQSIRMMSDLVKKYPQIKLLLVGDGQLIKEYSDMIEDLNLSDNIHLLGFRTDVADLMSLSDICISTSRQEGLPVNIMEAMATGLPLVVTACRGNRDLVHDDINGYIVDIDDHVKMADRISTLIQNESLRARFGKRNTFFISPYESRNVNMQMNNIYQRYTYPPARLSVKDETQA